MILEHASHLLFLACFHCLCFIILYENFLIEILHSLLSYFYPFNHGISIFRELHLKESVLYFCLFSDFCVSIKDLMIGDGFLLQLYFSAFACTLMGLQNSLFLSLFLVCLLFIVRNYCRKKCERLRSFVLFCSYFLLLPFIIFLFSAMQMHDFNRVLSLF